MSEVHPGVVIAGKFQVERVLGEGGMGYVVAARHLQLGQMVALKFMREDVMTDEYRSRFLREARNTVRLKSKHVSRVLDVGELDAGVPYMVLEYLEGTDLSDLLQKSGPFPPAEACDYIIQACEAIAEAHGHGIIHRDLKPANLFLTHGSGGEPVIKVLDFGVSKSLDLLDDTNDSGGHRHDSVVTKATDLLGSPSYMSPEQVMSSRDADAGSDVWSLGVILFRLISGKAPFTGNSLGDLIQNIVHGPMPNLRDARPDVPEGLEHVLWQALERDRKRRPDVIALARLLAPYAGPNAAPSLERIAILGPALVTSTVPMPAMSATSLTGRNGRGSVLPAPSSRTHDTQAGRSSGTFAWGLLLVAVVTSAGVVGWKLLGANADHASTQQQSAVTSTLSVTPPTPPASPLVPPTDSPTPSSPPPVPPAATIPVAVPPQVEPSPQPPPGNATRPGVSRPAQHPSSPGQHSRPHPPTSPAGKPASATPPSPTPAPAPPPPPTSDIPQTRE